MRRVSQGRASGPFRTVYRGAMPGESFFMTFGGLGLSLAGFAGLIAALTRRPAKNVPLAAYRVRTIVFLGFSLTFIGFGTVALYSLLTPDIDNTIRAGTILMAIPFVRGLLIDTRPGPVWPNEGERRFSVGLLVIMLAATIANVVLASVGFLQILMILGLIGPVSIFYATIRDATDPDKIVGGTVASEDDLG
jgi:hypothetical protein